jgi:thiol-disulfide isomerase/thioredoxin
MSYFSKSKNVKELSSKSFNPVKSPHLQSKKCSIVLFYSPECPYCKKVQEAYEELGKKALFIDVLAFNCEKYTGHLMKIKEEYPELIKGFPTIIFYKNGIPVEQQPSDKRSYEDLLKASKDICQNGN